MWSAHTLLAELHKKAALSPAAAVQDVQNTLAQSLRADVLPVVSYITRFSSLQNGDDFFLVRVHVLSRALVFVLSSFLAEWHRSDRGDGNERRPSSSADVPHLSMAEAALARELCEWISVLQQRADETRGSDADVRLFSVAYRKESDSLCSSIASPRQPAEAQGSFAGASTEQQVDRTCGGRTYWSDVRALRENTAEQFQLLQSTLTSRYTGAEDEERAMRSTENQSTPSCHRSWMDELCEQATAKRESCGRDDCRETQRQPPVASPSPFAGVTGVAAAVEEPTEVLASINAALNQVALSSSKEV
ncbi:hypothetical protein ABB37_00932 [Leptomonas pyrrhocoris]|uniref:Uncharacterized protein n=1 Tax=Leptomonas pyrrhocoris TaxID=157538 RepID=A0A0N0E0V6_LEPPY|nr:hypothetical protein ABB37_00932 [Leptomonas pyrrhocoris]KPA86891.1 hypothetical protein ABB37_00932 [Leptomonas pyrrhocoris]|eukprot:XP_015665330.1 hypothetical protein ABB37_00932 [Leptomonas pyrrhocoris]